MWWRLLVYAALSSVLFNGANTQQRNVVDPIRNALGFWGRLLNRMAQPRLPSDDELKFSIDDLDLEKLEQLLKKDTGNKFGGGNLADEHKIQQLLKPNNKFRLSGLPPLKATAKAPEYLAERVTRPNLENHDKKKKKNPIYNNNNNVEKVTKFDEHHDNPTAKALFKLAKQELEEEEKNKKKQKKTTIASTSKPLTSTTATSMITTATTTVTATTSSTVITALHDSTIAINLSTTAATLRAENATVVNSSSYGEKQTIKPSFQITADHSNSNVDNAVENVVATDRPLLSSSSHSPFSETEAVIDRDDEDDENLYFEKELRERMKHFEDVENALLNELGSGEELPDDGEKLDSLIKKMLTSSVATAIDNATDDRVLTNDNQTVSVINETTTKVSMPLEQKNSTEKLESRNGTKSVTDALSTDQTVMNVAGLIKNDHASKNNTEEKAEASNGTIAFMQFIPDVEEEDPREKESQITTKQTKNAMPKKPSSNDSIATGNAAELQSLLGSPNTGRKQSFLLENIDNKAALKPVEKIVDGIGPLILPLLGYGHDAPERYYPYLQNEMPNRYVRPEAFSDPKSLPEDIVGVSTAIATQLARSYMTDHIANVANTQQAAGAAAAQAAASSSYFQNLPLSLASAAAAGATNGLHPVVASASRTLDPEPSSSALENIAEDQHTERLSSENKAIPSSNMESKKATYYWPEYSASSKESQNYQRYQHYQKQQLEQLHSQQQSLHHQGISDEIENVQQLMKQPIKIPFKSSSNTHTTAAPVRIYPQKYGEKKSSRQSSAEQKYKQKQQFQQRYQQQYQKMQQKSLKPLNTMSLRRRYLPNPAKLRSPVRTLNASPQQRQVQYQQYNDITSATRRSTDSLLPHLLTQSGNYNYLNSNDVSALYSRYPQQYSATQTQNSLLMSNSPLHSLLSPLHSALFSPKMAEKIAASVAAALPGYQDIYVSEKKDTKQAVESESDGDTTMFGTNSQSAFVGDSGLISSSGPGNFPSGFPESFMSLQGNSIGITGSDGEKKLLL